jgi:uncharacterized membrane protein
MCGGYYSFAGIYGAAHYHRTPIEAILPVDIRPYDDRVETPEGTVPTLVDASHPVVAGIQGEWPALLGYNETTLKADGHLLATAGPDPLLAVRQVGRGRTLVWTSDIGPHWCPEPFARWDGYARLWCQAAEWLAGRR